jgi:ABC-2 type transport system ATP-binding protein
MIRAEGLSVHFKGGWGRASLKALDGIDLDVQDGDFFALLGQNGAGKSTAMYCFLGLLKPTAGSVLILGQAPVPGSNLFASIGYLPEEPHYHDYLTVEEAINYYGALGRHPSWQRRAGELIERLGLAEFRRLRLAKCSKGMKQKVGVVQCLLNEPRLLFLDEPMRGLDPLAVREFREILVERNREGMTVVMNSHILSEVGLVANRAAIIDRGRVIAYGRLSDLVPSDTDSYVVEIEPYSPLPDYFQRGATPAGSGSVEGTIPASRFYDFLDFTRARSLRVLRCGLRQPTLEEAFLQLLKRPGGHA